MDRKRFPFLIFHGFLFFWSMLNDHSLFLIFDGSAGSGTETCGNIAAVLSSKFRIGSIFRCIGSDHLDWKIIRMLSMTGVALSGLIFLECVAVLQSDKIAVSGFRICLTSGFLKRFFPGCGTTAFPVISCIVPRITGIPAITQPVEMHTWILLRISFTGIHAFLPCRLQVLIFLFRSVNLVLVADFSVFVRFFFRNFHQRWLRMSITEGFLIMVRMVNGLFSMAVFIGADRRNKPESIPGDRIIFMITEIRIFTTAVDQAITVMVCDLILVIETFIQFKNGIFQWFSGFIIVFIELNIVVGFPVFLVAVNLELQGTLPFFCVWNSANGRIKGSLAGFGKRQKNAALVHIQ